MSKYLGDRLPEAMLRALDATDLESEFGHAYYLITADQDGAPRPCMLSAGELLASDAGTIRVLLWEGTQTSQNLARGSHALICFVRDGAVFYAKGDPKELPKVGRNDAFEISIRSVESDEHPGMPVTQGIEFTCSPEKKRQILDYWQESLTALAAVSG